MFVSISNVNSQTSDTGEKKIGMGEKTQIKKIKKKIPPTKGCIKLEELFKNKLKYDNKTVRLRGKVKKFTADIMKKNWIHLQDGTEHDGRWDITVTTQEEFKEGDIITIEGRVILEMDFGYGYYYEILVQDAVLIKKE
jgi:hypothetical protein